jgi:hypothetical protein
MSNLDKARKLDQFIDRHFIWTEECVGSLGFLPNPVIPP